MHGRVGSTAGNSENLRSPKYMPNRSSLGNCFSPQSPLPYSWARVSMATTTTKPDMETSDSLRGIGASTWPPANHATDAEDPSRKPSQRDALQALLAFSALHEQVRRRKALAVRHPAFDSKAPVSEFEPSELFVLDEVLQLVAERAVAITGADGLAIALAEHDDIMLRAAAGTVRPDVGARIDRDSAFSGACFRTAQTVISDDTELDPRVNL